MNHGKEATQAPLLRDTTVQDFDILAIQEPWRNPFTTTSYNYPQSDFYLAYPNLQLARVCFYVNKRLDLASWTVTTHSPDLQTLTIQYEDGDRSKTIHVHNVYNPSPISYSSREQGTLATLRKVLDSSESHCNHMVLGDLNLHHPLWSGSERLTQHNASDYLIDLAHNANLELVTVQGSPTWRARGTQSTIDLTFMSQSLVSSLIRCEVRQSISQASDHMPIETTLRLQTLRQDTTRRRCWKKLDTDRINDFLKEKVPNTSLNTHLQVDTRVREITEAIQEAIDHSVPWARPSTQAKDFWSQDCDAIVREAKSAYHDYLREGTLATWENYQTQRNKKVAFLRAESRRCWREHVATTANDPQGAWKLMKWAKEKDSTPRTLPQMPDLEITDGSGQKRTVTDLQDKFRALKGSFFPDPRDADLTDIPNSMYPEPVTTDPEIQEQEVYDALRRVKADKAPGPDQIPNSILKATKEWLVPRLATVFNAALRLGHHPCDWKQAVTLALRKPRKENYSQLKAYRPIALLNTMGKLLEAVIARRLSHLAETHELLPRKQMGARPGRSAVTALQLLTEQVHEIWNLPGPQQVATILSLDISGAFDHVSHKRLAHNLRKRKVPLPIIRWIQSFVTDRTTTIKVAEGESRRFRANTGIPQGSPISPILFLFFVSDLLDTVDNEALRVSGSGFVDDINILTYSSTTERNCKVLEETHSKCLHWAATHGAIFAPEKYEVIHLTRARRRFNLKATPVLNGLRINTKDHIRVLGVQVDSKLKWRPHLAYVKEKATSLLLATSRITASTWGSGLNKAKLLYDTVVTPAILYGASVWYSPQGTTRATKNTDRQLETIQNSHLRRVTGAYKATSGRLLEKESDTPPITTHLEVLVARAMRRYKQSIGDRVIHEEATKIRRRRQSMGRTGNRQLYLTPLQEKTHWLRERIPENSWNKTDMDRIGHNDRLRPLTWKEALQQMATESWDKRWESFLRQVPGERRTPAHKDTSGNRTQLHTNLSKATSALVTQIRTEKIGLNAFLAQQRVPGYMATCTCGWRRQTAKHVLLSCPNFVEMRAGLLRDVGTNDYLRMVTTPRGAKAAAQFLQRTGLLPQFQLGL